MKTNCYSLNPQVSELSGLYQGHRISPSSQFFHSLFHKTELGRWFAGKKDCNSQSAPVRFPGATKECRLTAQLESGLLRTAGQPAMGQDYYAILHVTRNAEDAQIKKA